MLLAIVNDKKVEATPKGTGVCPMCKAEVISKCGEINEWHWAHAKGYNCDTWYEPETLWHKTWKMTFGKENAEIIINKNGKNHIADVLTKQNVVIELQNSPIQKKTIKEREKFYGDKMLWIINGVPFKDNFQIYNKKPKLSWRDDPEWWMRETQPKWGVIDNINKEFKWKHYRKSWENVQRHTFIDFGKQDLFWVKEGMGKSFGEGKYISKERFINKYDGNYEYYCQNSYKL